jgi:hypothetical protein
MAPDARESEAEREGAGLPAKFATSDDKVFFCGRRQTRACDCTGKERSIGRIMDSRLSKIEFSARHDAISNPACMEGIQSARCLFN